MQNQFLTGVDGHLQINKQDLRFSAYRWAGGISSLPMWTAASSPLPDQLPCLQQPLSLVVRGLMQTGAGAGGQQNEQALDPSDIGQIGDELEDVIVFVNDEITAACDFALLSNLQVGVTAGGVSFFELTLTSSWRYDDFQGGNSD